jgi:hypothetical protein
MMRRHLAVAGLLALVVAGAPTPSGAAEPGASPAESITVAPRDTIAWTPVAGPLGGTVPDLSVRARTPIAWHGGFAALETATYFHLDVHGHPSVTWPGPAVWTSTDGMDWTRAEVPGRVADELTLLSWRDGLAIVERRDIRAPSRRPIGFSDWRFRVWSSADGARWRRHGDLILRPEGALRDCALYDPQVVTAGDRLVVATTCYQEFGAGGSSGPSNGRVALTQRVDAAAIPVFAWSSADGRRWTRRLVTRIREQGATFVGFRPVQGGATVSLAEPWRIRWSRDGRRWRDIGGFPRDGDVRWFGAEPLDPGGSRWIATGQPGAVDHDPTGGLDPEPDHRTIWLRDADGPWWELAGEEGWAATSVAIDGSTVVVGIQDAPATLRSRVDEYRLLVSRDGGMTWTDVTTSLDLPASRCGIELHASHLLLRCVGEEEDVAVGWLRADLPPTEAGTPTP